jgi:lysophospholipase L1-like esterase
MRKIILSGAMALCAASAVAQRVTNQNLYDTLPTMVEHYHKRVAEFRKEPVVKNKIIFLGNSITEGGQWHKLTDNVDRINRGIGGDVTFGILQRLDEIVQRQPSKLFILIGINDIAKDFPEDVIVDNYRKILERVKMESPTTQIFIQSALPVNPEYKKFPQHYDKGDHVILLNRMLKDLSTKEGVAFIDLYPLFTDPQGRMEEKLTYDGLHLNEHGYKIWVDHLKNNGFL